MVKRKCLHNDEQLAGVKGKNRRVVKDKTIRITSVLESIRYQNMFSHFSNV